VDKGLRRKQIWKTLSGIDPNLQITEISMRELSTLGVYQLMNKSELIWNQKDIFTNSQLIRRMLMANAIRAFVF
jgi:hypothetical protein